MTTAPLRPRPRPCSTCPYRQDVPSGVWDAEEYAKLPTYDGPTGEQNFRTFGCHSDGGKHLCSGWLACHDPYELLAIRIGVSMGTVDPETLDYTTDVPVWGSGAEAAEHGLREVEAPSEHAVEAIQKVLTVQRLRERHG